MKRLMTTDKTNPADGASRLHAELEDKRNEIAHLHFLNGLLRCDAERYRWLKKKLQDAYDGNDLEIGDMIVGCRMTWARRDDRRCQAEVIWHDKRDEPIGIDQAIDEAMNLSSNAEITGSPKASPG